MRNDTPGSLRNFIIVWVGLSISLIGTRMTNFGIAVWMFEKTGQATALALVGIAASIPRLLVNMLCGVLVDRVQRKILIIISDTIAAVVTIALVLLLTHNRLETWHLYIGSAIQGACDALEDLAYQSSLSLMVSRDQYVRVNSMGTLTWYGSNMLSPALASALFYIIGLYGIMLVDLATFVFALLVVALTPIPRPSDRSNADKNHHHDKKFQNFLFGFRYIFSNPHLRTLLIVNSIFLFFHDFAGALQTPMILARTGNNPAILASVSVASGIGGVIAALVMSTLVIRIRQVYLFLFATISAGVGKLLVGLGQSIWAWFPAQFYTSLNFPVKRSSYQAIWMSKIAPEAQGRVFSAIALMSESAGWLGVALAAPLADFVFEPAMRSGGALIPVFTWLVGSGPGAGMALLYVAAALGMISVGVIGFTSHSLLSQESPVSDSLSVPRYALIPPDNPAQEHKR